MIFTINLCFARISFLLHFLGRHHSGQTTFRGNLVALNTGEVLWQSNFTHLEAVGFSNIIGTVLSQ